MEKGQAMNSISLHLEAFIVLVNLPLCSVYIMVMHISPLLIISLVSPKPELGPNRSPRLGYWVIPSKWSDLGSIPAAALWSSLTAGQFPPVSPAALNLSLQMVGLFDYDRSKNGCPYNKYFRRSL